MTLRQQVDGQIGRFHKALGDVTGLYPLRAEDDDTVVYVYNDMVEITFRWFDSPELASRMFESDAVDGERLEFRPYRAKGSYHEGLRLAQTDQLLKTIGVTLANMGFYRYRSDQFDFSEAVAFFPCPILVQWKPTSLYFQSTVVNKKKEVTE